MVRIGFIGLGDMGSQMARHLVEAGHEVHGFDLNGDAVTAAVQTGVEPANSSADAITDKEVVFLSLPDPQAVELVIEEVVESLDSGTVLVDTTTSTPSTTNTVAETLAEQRVDVLGAPISGGKHGADAGTLSVMAGGERAVYDACVPLFETFATNCFYVGTEPGHGHAVKLLNNILSYTTLLATSEAVIVGRVAGLDPELLVDVFSASTGRSSASDDKIPNQVLTGDYDTGFPLSLTEKDVVLFTQFAEELGTPALMGTVTRMLVGFARSSEGDDGDMTRVYDFLERVMLR